MPCELIWEDRGVLFKFRDVVTGDELVQANLDIYSDPRFESVEYELFVFPDSVVIKVSAEKVRRVAELDAEASIRNPNILVAVVASQLVIRGLVNLYSIQHEVSGGTWKTDYFETEEEARKWLAETSD